MREIPRLLLRFKLLALLFIGFIVAYLWLAVTTQPPKATLEKFHLTVAQLHRLSLTIALPYVAIWIIAFFGYAWLRTYAKALGDSDDGKAFGTISKGILLIALWLPVSALASVAASRYFGAHPTSTPVAIRIVNYINVVLLLPAFYLLYRGSKRLVAIAKVRAHGLTQRQSMLFVVFTVLYTFLVLSDSVRHVASAQGGTATYYLPDWLIIFTIIIPRLLAWFIGLAAVSNIFLYRQKVKGLIYKEALRSMAIGLGVFVCGLVVYRALQSLTAILSHWSLAAVLLLDYALLIILGFGAFLIAKGSKRLLKIEES